MSQLCIEASQDCRLNGLHLTLNIQYWVQGPHRQRAQGHSEYESEPYPGASRMKGLFQTFRHTADAVGVGTGFRAVLSVPNHSLTNVAPNKSRPFLQRAGFITRRAVDCGMWIARGFKLRKREIFPVPVPGHPDLTMTTIPLFFEDENPFRNAEVWRSESK